MYKPRLFIGSSSESLKIAYAIQENLEASAQVTVWTQGVFALSSLNLEALLRALENFDCAVFAFLPTDTATIRDRQHAIVRDNVIFELGLFIGRVGKDRCFVVVPRD